MAPAEAKGQLSGSRGLIFTDWHEDDETGLSQAEDHRILQVESVVYEVNSFNSLIILLAGKRWEKYEFDI